MSDYKLDYDYASKQRVLSEQHYQGQEVLVVPDEMGWTADGEVDTTVGVTGQGFWLASGAGAPTYKLRDGLIVARAHASGSYLYPFGVSGLRVMLNRESKYEFHSVFYQSGGTPIVTMYAGDVQGESFWQTGIYSGDLRSEVYASSWDGGSDIDEYYDSPHGVTLPAWVWVKTEIDFANGTFKTGVVGGAVPTEPTVWTEEYSNDVSEVGYWTGLPLWRVYPYGNTIDLRSFLIKRV
jgi:hypothetical protein